MSWFRSHGRGFLRVTTGILTEVRACDRNCCEPRRARFLVVPKIEMERAVLAGYVPSLTLASLWTARRLTVVPTPVAVYQRARSPYEAREDPAKSSV